MNKIVRLNGSVYRIITGTLLGRPLPMSVECVFGPDKGTFIPNLNVTRTKLAQAIKFNLKNGLVG